MDPNIQPVTETTPIVKENKLKKVLIYIAVALISAGLTGAAVWYIMDRQNNNEKTDLSAQIATKAKTISGLQKTITTLNKASVAGTATTTATAAATAATPNYLELLKTFCAGDGKYTVNNYYFASVPNGLYGGCNVAAGPSGFFRIAKVTNGSWVSVIDTQASSTPYLREHQIPMNVVISPDAYNLLP